MLSVYVTFGSAKEAETIAKKAVEEKLAACANFFPATSIYMWKGRLCREKEVIVILKTTNNKYAKLEQRIKQLHSYEVPCIVALPWKNASKKYAKWVKDSCS